MHRADPDDQLTLGRLPSMQQLEAEVRRRPIGRTIDDICRDLGVAPSLCAGTFWNVLLSAFQRYRGNLAGFTKEMRRRETQIEKELSAALAWPVETREAIRQVLGFMIGEPPVDPFANTAAPPASLAACPATGPP